MDKFKNFGFLLKDLSRHYVLRFEQRATAISLTLNQCKALIQLEKHEGINQARLAELTDVEPMAMVRILDHMETDQLIERRPDPADRRARRLYLTDKGKPRVDEIWHLAELTRAEVFANIADGDREVFIRVLEQLHTNASAVISTPLAPLEPAPAVAPTGTHALHTEPTPAKDEHGLIRTEGTRSRQRS